MKLITLILAGIALMPTLARAQEEFEFRVGGDIFNWCSAPIRSTACLAYIEGIADALASGASIHGWRACFKERVNAALLQSMTVHFLDGHREDWNKGAAGLVAAAFAEGFPCEDEPDPTPRSPQ
jgi:hypothetical protein